MTGPPNGVSHTAPGILLKIANRVRQQSVGGRLERGQGGERERVGGRDRQMKEREGERRGERKRGKQANEKQEGEIRT